MNNDSLGYLSYKGEGIQHGIFDARQSAHALLGFDSIMRYFIKAENPEFRNVDFNFPVKIKEGSWVIEIPSNIDQIITIVEGGLLLTYATSLAKQAAKDGFLETGPVKDIKKVIQGAINIFKWCVKIRKHIKGKKTEEKINLNKKIVNLVIDNRSLEVPIPIYILYKELPVDFFNNISEAVSENVSLIIGVKLNDGEFEQERISYADKPFFYIRSETSPDVLFPELKDGQYVELDGEVTRNNGKTNTIGFEYKGHILTCEPDENQSLTKFKNQIISKSEDKFFSSVTICGKIDRSDGTGNRPKIKFTKIIPRDVISIKEQSLF